MPAYARPLRDRNPLRDTCAPCLASRLGSACIALGNPSPNPTSRLEGVCGVLTLGMRSTYLAARLTVSAKPGEVAR